VKTLEGVYGARKKKKPERAYLMYDPSELEKAQASDNS